MTKSYNEWLLEQNEPLNEDVGTALVALTTILVGIPVGTAVAKSITNVIDTISTLRQERKFAEANSLAKKSLDKYKHLSKEKLQEGTTQYKSAAHAEAAAHLNMALSHDPEKHPKIHHTAMSRYHTVMARLEKKRSGMHNSKASEHTALAAHHGVDVKKHRLQEEESGECTSNVVGNVEASGPYTNRSNKKEKPDSLKMKSLEETIDSMFSLPKFYEDQDDLVEEAQRHRVMATVSEPDHQSVSQRKTKQLRYLNTTANSKEEAIKRGHEYYKKRGYKVHEVTHHSHLS
jgi:hypothetical protein